MSAPRALVSSARCSPTSCRRSRFQVAARDMPQGKSAACDCQWTVSPIQTNFPTGVPSLKRAPLAPLGPSDVLIEGIPFEGIGTVLQKSLPARRESWILSHKCLDYLLEASYLFLESKAFNDPAGTFPWAFFDEDLLAGHLCGQWKLRRVSRVVGLKVSDGSTLFMYASAKTGSGPLVYALSNSSRCTGATSAGGIADSHAILKQAWTEGNKKEQ